MYVFSISRSLGFYSRFKKIGSFQFQTSKTQNFLNPRQHFVELAILHVNMCWLIGLMGFFKLYRLLWRHYTPFVEKFLMLGNSLKITFSRKLQIKMIKHVKQSVLQKYSLFLIFYIKRLKRIEFLEKQTIINPTIWEILKMSHI